MLQPLNSDDWVFGLDNAFASAVLQAIDGFQVPQRDRQVFEFCERCSSLSLDSNLRFKTTLAEMRARSSLCALCELFSYVAAKRLQFHDDILPVEVRQIGSSISIVQRNQICRVLSLCQTQRRHRSNASLLGAPSSNASNGPNIARNIQIGLPQILDNQSPAFSTLLHSWLADCDANHPGCGHGPDRSSRKYATYPTRLIDAGTLEEPSVRLVSSSTLPEFELEKVRYIALSYPWGDQRRNVFQRTTQANIAAYYEQIPFDSMPKLYRHAIRIIRDIGVRYLWIDSLCIIQGAGGDFQDEAPRMDAVFSGAYCVIAASRARGTSDGILEDRPQRRFVEMPGDYDTSVYVCEDVDDFQRDVIDGELNKRGWVLQERALARRTIYFCAQQTYWECGQGIRCETFTKMNNKQASFLGDPNFPKVAEDGSKGARIRLYETLYEQYSRLAFSRDSDRPVAIAGLEQRLLRAFTTNGGYGMFQRYLPRCLLWCRADDHPLVPITFSAEQEPIPSWSWMKYQGSISFLDPPFGGTEWNSSEFESPWASLSGPCGRVKAERIRQVVQPDKGLLRVTIRNLVVGPLEASQDSAMGMAKVILDNDVARTLDNIQCVVIGKTKAVYGSGKHRYYLLLVEKTDSQFCTRVGVAVLPEDRIVLAGSGTQGLVL